MHTILKNDAGQVEGVLCVDRVSQTAIILQAEIGQLDTLATIAKGMKAPMVQVIIPEVMVVELEAHGWKRDVGMVVMSK